ncbi:MAG: hypothetical protein K8T10_00040 [Candidatus Eremiobacteraeota bacterium]|nr:hypothetical protein [Candidatus Eremiobacteraeota bacterium]
MKYIKSTILILLILLVIPVSAKNKIDPDRLKSKCESILGDNQGTIIVIDLKSCRPIVVLNPTIACSRESRPGSVFKLVTAAALLEKGKIDPHEKMNCKNNFRFMDKKYICSKTGGHGKVNLFEAIAKSCSVYFYEKSLRISESDLKNTAEKFGFGRSMPSVSAPSKPSPGKCTPPSDPRLFIEFAVGDEKGIKITPYQSANMLCIIATGKPLEKYGDDPEFRWNTLKILRKGMEMSAKTGTCKLISKSGIDGAGKTGTPTNERIPDKTHGWFIGYMPAKNPRYGVVVFLEDGNGSAHAVPRGVEVMKILR